jgi:hypothetical protein
MRIFASRLQTAVLCLHGTHINKSLASLQRKAFQSFSEGKEGAVLLGEGELSVRNSETYELKLQEVTDSRKIQNLVYQIDAKSSLKNIAELFDTTFMAKNTQVSII